MINIGLLGAGRIGITHARAVQAVPDAQIAAIFDPFDAAAETAVGMTGARRASVNEIMSDPEIDGVILATPTDLHADQIEMAARAGKAIFCEKPIDLDISRVRSCLDVVRHEKARLMVGFNRRFDHNFSALHRQIAAGAVGDVELVQITSRDPGAPPVDYIKRSGGLFKDMMIHDFDMARFLVGEEFTEVSASGSVLTDAAIGVAGDIDTATASLKTETGKIVTITNSRRATYGYDQRIEVHGSKGMIFAENMRATTVVMANDSGYHSEPLLDFFMERYALAYQCELAAFCVALKEGTAMLPNGEDGLMSLLLADAAGRSMREGRVITPGIPE